MTAAATPQTPAPPPARLFAALIVVLTATCLTLSLVTLDRLKYILLAANHRSLGMLPHATRPLDWALAGLAAATAAALILPPRMRRQFVSAWQRQSWPMFVPVTALLVWTGHAILTPGLLVTGDAGTHVARVTHLMVALSTGHSPYWDNDFFGGSTLLQFTGPLFHWLATAVALVLGDPTLAIKLVCFALRLLAALFMYKLLRTLGTSRAAAALGALFYGGAFFVTYLEVIRSSYPQMINLAAMPAIFYFLETVLRKPAILGTGTVGLALATALFIGSHQPTALLFGFLTAAYLLGRLRSVRPSLTLAGSLATATILALLGSVFFLLPFAVERGMTGDDFSVGSLIWLAWPSIPTVRAMAIWGSATSGEYYGAYAGLPMLAAAVAGCCLSVTRFRHDNTPLASACRSLIVLIPLSLMLKDRYVREATFTFFFLCTTAGIGIELLSRCVKSPAYLFAAVFLVTAADAAPLAIQPWARTDLRAIAAAGDYLAARAHNTRVVEVRNNGGEARITADPTLRPLAYADLQLLTGPHKQDATRALNPFAAVLKLAQGDLRAGRELTPVTRRILASLNVGWVVGDDDARMGLPDDYPGTGRDDVLGAYWTIPGATPFLASGRLETMARPAAFDTEPFWDEDFDNHTPAAQAALGAIRDIDARMSPDLASRTARAILVASHPETWANAAAPEVRQLSYDVRSDVVRLSVMSSGPGYIRIAHPIGLGTTVTRDGAAVTPIPDVESLIVLTLHKGQNDFVIAAKPSLLRRVSFWTSIGTLAVLLAAGTAMAMRGRRPAR